MTGAEARSPATERPRLHWIESLRGLAATLVVFHHMLNLKLQNPPFEPYFDFGVFGVIIFFSISGFIIPYSVIGMRRAPAVAFPLGRAFRLYPAYWLSLCFVALVVYVPWKTLLINLTMTQRFFGCEDAISVFWTLQVELIFYALIEFLILRRKILTLSVYPLLAALSSLIAIAAGIGRSFFNKRLPIAPAEGLTVMFVATTYFMHLNYGLFSRRKMLLFALSMYAALCLAFFLGYSKDWGYHETPMRFCLSYLLGVLVFLMFLLKGMSNSLLSFLGRVSYSVYLFHIPVIMLLTPHLYRYGAIVYIPVEAVMILAIATAMFYLVERPMVRVGRKVIQRQAPAELLVPSRP